MLLCREKTGGKLWSGGGEGERGCELKHLSRVKDTQLREHFIPSYGVIQRRVRGERIYITPCVRSLNYKIPTEWACYDRSVVFKVQPLKHRSPNKCLQAQEYFQGSRWSQVGGCNETCNSFKPRAHRGSSGSL